MDFYGGVKIHDGVCGIDCPHWVVDEKSFHYGICGYCGQPMASGSECICAETTVTREPRAAEDEGDGGQ